MSVLIKGMEMPQDGSWKTIRIYPDGTCAIPNWQGDCTFLKGTQAVELPPHGRLIDIEPFMRGLYEEIQMGQITYTSQEIYDMMDNEIKSMPTIIEAEGRE